MSIGDIFIKDLAIVSTVNSNQHSISQDLTEFLLAEMPDATKAAFEQFVEQKYQNKEDVA